MKLISLLILFSTLWIKKKEIILANKRTEIWTYFLCELTFQTYWTQQKTNRNRIKNKFWIKDKGNTFQEKFKIVKFHLHVIFYFN